MQPHSYRSLKCMQGMYVISDQLKKHSKEIIEFLTQTVGDDTDRIYSL